MRVLLQRVTQASVSVDDTVVASIHRGYLLFMCVMCGDTEESAAFLAHKIASLRLFTGENDRINDLSIRDIDGDVLVISQFTLAADVRKGSRPDYTAAAAPTEARRLYDMFIELVRNEGIQHIQTGVFGADMKVSLTNDGPVTVMLEK